jgi:hypothetical protein
MFAATRQDKRRTPPAKREPDGAKAKTPAEPGKQKPDLNKKLPPLPQERQRSSVRPAGRTQEQPSNSNPEMKRAGARQSSNFVLPAIDTGPSLTRMMSEMDAGMAASLADAMIEPIVARQAKVMAHAAEKSGLDNWQRSPATAKSTETTQDLLDGMFKSAELLEEVPETLPNRRTETPAIHRLSSHSPQVNSRMTHVREAEYDHVSTSPTGSSALNRSVSIISNVSAMSDFTIRSRDSTISTLSTSTDAGSAVTPEREHPGRSRKEFLAPYQSQRQYGLDPRSRDDRGEHSL